MRTLEMKLFPVSIGRGSSSHFVAQVQVMQRGKTGVTSLVYLALKDGTAHFRCREDSGKARFPSSFTTLTILTEHVFKSDTSHACEMVHDLVDSVLGRVRKKARQKHCAFQDLKNYI